MCKSKVIANTLPLVAEQQLRGCKAGVERVMAEWLKTLYSVVSKDHLNIRLDSSWKLVGKPINPTEYTLTCINNTDGDNTANTNTTNMLT
jgi:hypothetical protein